MGITQQQTIDKKPKEEGQKFSYKRLFPIASVIKPTLELIASKINVFDFISLFCLFVIGYRELIGHPASYQFYILLVMALCASFYNYHWKKPDVM